MSLAGVRSDGQIPIQRSLRDIHRMRSVENIWLSGTKIGFAGSRIGDHTTVIFTDCAPFHI